MEAIGAASSRVLGSLRAGTADQTTCCLGRKTQVVARIIENSWSLLTLWSRVRIHFSVGAFLRYPSQPRISVCLPIQVDGVHKYSNCSDSSGYSIGQCFYSRCLHGAHVSEVSFYGGRSFCCRIRTENL